MAKIQLLQFNTYYNRQYKPLPADYSSLVIHEQNNVNFNPNDGVNTSLVLNMPSNNEDAANYCLVLDEEGTIVSKWFIVDATRTRLNQYEVVLRRDLLSDYYGDIINAPVFIEKATLNADNPLIFNSEDMTFNQIKTAEKPIRDKTNCAWIVGYFKNDYSTEAKTITIPTAETQSYTSYTSLNEVPYINEIRNGYFSGVMGGYMGIEVRTWNVWDVLVSGKYDRFRFTTNGTGSHQEIAGTTARAVKLEQDPTAANIKAAAQYLTNQWNNDEAWRNAAAPEVKTQAATDEFLRTWPVNGKVIKVGTVASGFTYYKITRSSDVSVIDVEYKPVPGTVAYSKIKGYADATALFKVENDAEAYTYKYSYLKYSITMTQIANPASITVTIPANSHRTQLEDAPYDMFAIPYGSPSTVYGEQGTTTPFLANKEDGLAMANAIATAMGGTGGYLLDLQLLPYCPIQTAAQMYGVLNLRNLTLNKDFALITKTDASSDTIRSVVLFPQKTDFSLSIDTIYLGDDAFWSLDIDITEPKIQALCDTYRLVSPNYNGQFEFNAAKNGGVSYFDVDCSYKPYSPYIHVNPHFGGLYGKDFNDARGLICGGDFSLPTITDQWINYEINNKNYLNTFNRQIENMEVNNKYAREQDKWTAIAGTVQGAVSGATAGSVAGGLGGGVGMGVGLGVGAVAGGIVSGLAGAADVRINQALRNEALDYTIDQFGYALGSIQALPYSLNRVSSFNINNKIFPILEYYTCTDIEKEALRNKIKYNGMTVMAIGYIADYIQPEPSYIKGKLIRLESLDNHTVNEIANELNKGFYI